MGEITPGDYRIIVKKDNKPVLKVENMYEVLCRTHAEIDNHSSFHPLANKPIIAKDYLFCIDLIDLSYDADGDYKYICHARDHFTRFSWAKPLTSKRAVE
ncbi:17182_t:CDS:2, partial [Funneliformis caledonium]